MEPQALHAALTATLSCNTSERQAAETVLRSVDATPGYLPCLFQIINSDEVTPQVKQAGIIYFKNLVQKHWHREHKDPQGGVVFSEGDKQAIRVGLLETLRIATDLTRPQILQSLRVIAETDFPHKMTGFVHQLGLDLDPALQRPDRAMASLRAVRALCKVYEYKSLERRQAPVHAILTGTFPQLTSILEIVLSGDPADEAGATVLKLGMKTLWSVVHQSVPHYLQNEHVFMRWMQVLYRVLEMPVPAALAVSSNDPSEDDARAKKPLWTAKRWAAQVIQRLMSKYGNLKQAQKQFGKEEKAGELAISQLFHNELAARFLNLQLQVLSAKSQGAFLPERLVVETCSYIMSSVALAITWQHLKQNVMPLVTHVIFPVLCFDQRDRIKWAEDPIDFVRTTYDVMEDYTSQRVQCSRLLVDLCQKRAKTCLTPILNFCHEVLLSTSSELQNHQQDTPGTDAATRRAALDEAAARKDGGMYLLGSLRSQLCDPVVHIECGAKVEWLLTNCIATELQSSIPHLRARACWAIGNLVVLLDKNTEFYLQIVRCVLSMLRDPELPVRFQAAVCLRYLVYDHEKRGAWRSIEGVVAEMLPLTMEELFGLMDQVGSDELVTTLDVLISSFAARILPYAQGLCLRLSETFIRFACSEDPDTDSSLAASQAMAAISTLLDAMQDSNGGAELFSCVEASLIPLLLQCLTPDPSGEYPYTEFIEDVLEIVTRLTFYSPTISEGMWSLYQPLAKCFTDWAIDYLCEFQLALSNYIARGAAAFVSVPDRPQAMFRMVQRVLEHSDSQDKDVSEVCLLAQSMLLYCKSAPLMEEYLEPFITLVVQRLHRYPPKRENARSELIKVVAACLHVNPVRTLAAIERHSSTQMVFQTWLESIVVLGERDTPRGKETTRTHFRKLNDKKLCIIGLTSILHTPISELPASIQAGLGHLLAALITLFFDMDVLRRRRLAAVNTEAVQLEDEVRDNAVSEVNDDEDYDPRLGKGTLDGILAHLQDQAANNLSWDDDEEDEDDEENEQPSPFDSIDEVLFFADAWNGIQHGNDNPAALDHILKALDAGQRGFMDSILASVPQRQAMRQQFLSGAASVLVGGAS